jgi:hypothetical protein
MPRCPDNHESETPDFCSVCGVEIVPAAPGFVPAAGVGPTCGTIRESLGQAFCEGCGHNFRTATATANPVPVAVAPPLAAPAAPRLRWDVVVRVDPMLYGKPNDDAPVDQPVQTFTLFEVENLIGRAGTDVHVHVPIRSDPGVSRRQALLLRLPDGGLVLRDLNSANGTQVNGAEVVAGADVPLRDGDSIAIGAWTRLAVRALVT